MVFGVGQFNGVNYWPPLPWQRNLGQNGW